MALIDFNLDCFMAVDKKVVHAFLEDGGKVPQSEDATSDVPLVSGASVIGMANSRSVICLGVSWRNADCCIIAGQCWSHGSILVIVPCELIFNGSAGYCTM
jgi:hypothetical protein